MYEDVAIFYRIVCQLILHNKIGDKQKIGTSNVR